MRTLFEMRLAECKHVLLAGCGGGFDVAGAIPLQTWLIASGAAVTLANLSFAELETSGAERIGPAGWIVEPQSRPMPYFPERCITEWLLGRGLSPRIYGLRPTGVVPYRDTLRAIVEREGIDAIVLVDGGTDSLARGDEQRLGTIEEDALSVIAAAAFAGTMPVLLACLGFGIDHYHGVSHHSFLENTAEMIRAGGYLGCISLCAGTPAGDAFLDLVDFLDHRQPGFRSIVAHSIASAIRGEFGDYHALDRTAGSTLFINPLMSLYWCFNAAKVAAMMRFAARLEGTDTFQQIVGVVADMHGSARKRPFQPLPL